MTTKQGKNLQKQRKRVQSEGDIFNSQFSIL